MGIHAWDWDRLLSTTYLGLSKYWILCRYIVVVAALQID
jgi:hypothetical protein